MGRRLVGKLVLATHNAGKLEELRALIAPHGVEVTSAGELGLPVPEETGETFRENALIKALAAVSATELPCLADNSGLCVDALDGEPGVHTADWAGPDRDFSQAMTKLEARLQAVGATTPSQRRGTFVSYLVLVWPDGHTEEFEGRANGTLVWPPRGKLGHGYDPVFRPDGSDETFAEMSEAKKNRRSHRSQSFEKFALSCLG